MADTTTVDALYAKLAAYRAEMRACMLEKIKKGEAIDQSVRTIHDPFSSRNPHQIKANPAGKVLSWKNPKYRQERGWRGWTPVTYDDEIGRELDTYIIDPPHKMEGSAHLDNYVRRGTDSVLCWIPEEVWLARQLEQSQRALEAETRAAIRGTIVLKAGVTITGEGGTKREAGRSLSRQDVDDALGLNEKRLGHTSMLSEGSPAAG